MAVIFLVIDRTIPSLGLYLQWSGVVERNKPFHNAFDKLYIRSLMNVWCSCGACKKKRWNGWDLSLEILFQQLRPLDMESNRETYITRPQKNLS
jgi:hypothetical protein